MIRINSIELITLVKKVSKSITLIILIILSVGCSKSVESSRVGLSKVNLEVSEEEIMKTINDIAKEASVLGTAGEKQKAKYLKEKMEHYGYRVEYQDFEVFDLGENARRLLLSDDLDTFLNINPINSTQSKGIARNVIVKSKNFDKNKKTLYLFSHYDTTKKTTGVYDNATGVSTVSEVARVLQNYDSKEFNTVYIFFSAEEYFRMGSRYFISQLSQLERENMLGAINVDMVGYTGFVCKNKIGEELLPVGAVEINLNSWVEQDSLVSYFNEKFDDKYSVNNEFGGLSDDLTFARLGVPTIYLADKNCFTGFEIEEENFEVQAKPIKTETIADLSKDIASFIKGLDVNNFTKIQ